MVLLIPVLFAAVASAKCFKPANAHPPPQYDLHDPVLQSAFELVSTALTIAVAAPEFASTSFSVEVTSSKESLWSLHHTARERNASRPDIPQVNGDALYRIASITKTFTVLGILYQHAAGNLSLDDTVNRYLPELGDKSDGGIPWKDITLRSLASQLSGIPSECMSSDKNRLMFEGCHTAQGMHADLFTRGTERLRQFGRGSESRGAPAQCIERRAARVR
jgi:CubicO group peptidase (beta-lactamase class C family)